MKQIKILIVESEEVLNLLISSNVIIIAGYSISIGPVITGKYFKLFWGYMFRIIITISVIFSLTIMGIFSLIYMDYNNALLYLISSVLILFLMSYSKFIIPILKNRFSVKYITKLTKKIFSDISL